MNESLQSAVKKMGMSKCPTGLGMFIDLILDLEPKSLETITEHFGLTDDEVKAFNDFVETRKKK